jgi:hypothetical protein
MDDSFNPALQSRRTGLSWDQEAKDKIKDITHSFSEAGVALSNRQLFLLCLGIGWKHKLNPGVPPRRTDSARLETLKDKDYALFNAIAMEDSGSFEVLQERDRVLDIVEGYAAGGLRKLAEMQDSSHDLVSELVSEMWPAISNWEDLEITAEEEN